ncbi:MAG: ATP-dependent zinc metalloprotease FtsH [Saprospiraceae bacterium]|nr:ATP-dependent zinc metalloprotease FtsH [Saprospiraceae bacterium]MBK7810795.1 ATP-dependent zinc metalloprotease FtsH [Saprospiraceae bacterium]MBK9630390.1 ATP-dependent zinc metalloprotease FtsH [Saprospiraceae bacterium]
MESQDNNQPKKPASSGFNSYWIYGILFLALIGINFFYLANPNKEPIPFSRFEQMVTDGDVDKLEVTNNKLAYVYIKEKSLYKENYKDAAKSTIGLKPHYHFNVGPIENFATKMDKLNEKVTSPLDVNYVEKQNWLGPILSFVLPFLIILGIWIIFMRRMGGGSGGPGGQIFNIGKSKAMLFEKDSNTNITFEDVAGLEEAKEEVMEVVDFLKNPKKYTALGGKIPKGVLLVGPPGTGKTLLAKAVAGEAAVPFFTISGSDFVEMFVGVGASRVRDLFRQAREKAPCIVFIDEIDAVGRARGKTQFQGGNDERENTLNQLLVEMDGFSTDKGVILMAATNRPDILDTALLRPGRFDRQISIDPPDLKGRAQIFKVHLKKLKLSDEVTPEILSEMTPGFAGADIANICNEAALVAARRNKQSIELDDFNYALDRVIGGLEKKNKIISPEEKEVIAYHEAGHAICGWYLKYASPLVKVTIVPRGIGTLGYAQYLPKEEYITRTEAMLDRICMTMGGRAAEKIIFDKISTGAQSDLDQVTKMGYSMISVFGMNDKVGNVSFYGMSQEGFQRPYSEETAKMMDEEVRLLINIQYEKAQNLLSEKRNELEVLAQELLKKEVLLKSDVERLIGPSPYHKDKHPEPSPLDGQHVTDEKQDEETKTEGLEI